MIVVQLSPIQLMGVVMDVVIDISALVAVIVDEPERERIIDLTAGHRLIGPGSIPWEVGNAFSAMLKQDRLTIDEARKGLAIFEEIPIRYTKPDFPHALALAHRTNMYAYDAYFLDCAMKHSAPLLTLDRKLRAVAKDLNITTWEV
jgi:predicted nucleic acid-binding protein